jgi:hypothetical protein
VIDSFEKEIESLYKDYIHDICPLVIQYEVLSGDFPTEILNEVRAIFKHIGDCVLSDDEEVKKEHIQKAKGHIKRSMLDCYKYLCIAYEDYFRDFERLYRQVDLSLIDNGEFLPKLMKTRQAALTFSTDARKLELNHGSPNDVYSAFEIAFNTYVQLHDFVADAYTKVETLKKKAITKNALSWLGIALGIMGVMGTIYTIISFYG